MNTSTKIRQRKPVLTTEPVVDQEDVKKTLKTKSYHDNYMAGFLFLMSLPVRFQSISLPARVVFDEVHFGKYAAYYIKQSFFFDVHPPLAKLLIALVAWISGFKGDFDFKEIGNVYPETVPYIQMRLFGTLLGSMLVPLAYLTIRDAGHSRIAATLTALAICFENGLITNNRLILLDSYLLFFTAFTVFSWNRFYKTKSFGRSWFIWLVCTGVGLGCTFSSKWVGLFTIATIGLSTVKQLWSILGDISVTKRQYTLHFFARVICLIIVPALIYIGTFYIHFSILTRSGPGESYLSMQTQNEMKGYAPIDTPRPIVYGSLITIRHLETTESFLHSHNANYAEGSQQQQVTLYPHRDNNNWWRILKADNSGEAKKDLLASDNTTWLEYVRNGDVIRLEHVETSPRKLHSHDIPAPVTDTDYHKEVSAYGFNHHEGDANDNWILRIDENRENSEAGEFLQSRRSRFRLKHSYQDCYLFSSFERLPDWGFDQQEVSCISEGMKPKTMWQIDESDNRILPKDVVMEPEHRPKFFEKFARLHKYMWIINNELTEEHPFESRPKSWPLLLSGISFWQGETQQIILLGNPIVYWLSTAAVGLFLIVYGILQLRTKRGYKDTLGGLRSDFESSTGFFVLGWALHYLPFFKMERQLFLHHYMPALYFAVLTFGTMIDFILKRFPRTVKMTAFICFSVCIIYSWWVYSPLTYGRDWTVSQCENARLLDTWELDCERYHPIGSPERAVLSYQGVETKTKTTNVIYVDQKGKRVPIHEVPQEYRDENDTYEEYMDDNFNDEDDDDEEYDDEEEEEEEVIEPTEAPEPPEYEPEFIDGKEVFGEDDDEEDWPKTIYGMDPEADEDDENPAPLTVRSIPATRHVDY